ncbi:hypothetical protein BH23BAC3_BH23BAC3_23270 [soil metagenome]
MMVEPSGIANWLIWLENTSIAVTLRQSIWIYPAVEIVHIVGFAVLVGAAIMYDLRLIGLSKRIQVTDATKHLSGWAQISFLAVVPSGFLLFIVDATSLASNSAFQIKLILIVAAIVNAGIFHQFTLKTVLKWNQNIDTPLTAKIAGIFSILLWILIISSGRLIAYI